MTDEFDTVAEAAWQVELPPIRHAIFDVMNQPFMCCICDKNEWVIERVMPDGTYIWTCSHGAIDGVIRQVDSVNGRNVFSVTELD